MLSAGQFLQKQSIVMAKNQTVLFHSTVFGPVHSRRLGTSLGVNLSPNDGKVCSFDCLYCEAGFNAQGPGTTGFPQREQVSAMLEEKLRQMKSDGQTLDVITFSGNGEPTLHPCFPEILADTMRLRSEFFPDAKVSVLSNSTCLGSKEVADALRQADFNILKFDSAIEATMRLIDRPNQRAFTVDKLISELAVFGKDCIVQTMMLRGEYEGNVVDNTTDEEIASLIEAYRKIGPKEVMLYSIDRDTPAEHLVKVPSEELRMIGKRIEEASGVHVRVN